MPNAASSDANDTPGRKTYAEIRPMGDHVLG